MLLVFALVLAIVAGLGWFLAARSRRRRRQYELRNHHRYLKTKRDSTIAGWFRVSRTRRLTYQPDPDRKDGSGD